MDLSLISWTQLRLITLQVSLLVALYGCAHVYVDADGTKHIVGLVHVTVPANPENGEATADSLKVISFGLSLHQTEIGTSLTFGYEEETIIAFRSNACIIVPQVADELSNQVFGSIDNALRASKR